MSTFFYRAVAGDGRTAEGVLEAVSERAVAGRLREMRLVPVYIGAKKQALPLRLEMLFRRRKVGRRQRLFFTRELAALVKAGLPLDRCLSILVELAGDPKLRVTIQDVLKELKGGRSLADALATQPEVFGRLYVNMVRAGEASGTLQVVLERLTEFEEAAEELRSYFVSALIYPTLLATVGVAAIVVMMVFVIPRFGEVFADAGQALPWPTAMLLTASALLRTWGWLLLAALVAGFVALRRWRQTEAGRERWDQWKLRLPLAGDVFRKIEAARFARTMGTLLANAVPILTALNLVRDIISNQVVARALEPVAQGVKRGLGLAAPLRESAVFPPLTVELVRVGEETGRLDAMLLDVADIYEREVRSATKRLIALFEPAMILTMGLIVGIIVISMLVGIVSINEVPF